MRMPAPYGTNHPTYDPEEPGSAGRFFDEVEMAATEAGIIGEPAVRTFAQWRAEVMKILPRRAQEEAGAMKLEPLKTRYPTENWCECTYVVDTNVPGALQEKLVPGTGRSDEDPYEWEDVISTAKALVAGGTTGPFGDMSLEPSVSEYSRVKMEAGGSSGSSKAIETLRIKQEELDSNFQTMLSKLDVLGYR
ncbi:hypothetical protein DFP72DRAFT_858425 [Ephemerocybe angulata]|uniref:Uncharacterized protein n=1 Tax=Ephemerocybe angulata TaxID=980116 RepID=A0A8H6HCT8_9AGAR|nr:hypothetical protein DFP72DRAFT_858425 [Tulosesus angulatus]